MPCLNVTHNEVDCFMAKLPESEWCEPCRQLAAERLNDAYVEAADLDFRNRLQRLKDIEEILQTVREVAVQDVIAGFREVGDDEIAELSEQVLDYLEAMYADEARVQQTWTDHRGRP